MKIIIFEDNYIVAMTLELMVKQLIGEVLGCYDSTDDVVSLVENKKADCLLMDIQLKGKMTGLEAVEELRKHSQIQVIFLSGNNSKEIVDRIKSIENSTFISKPYTDTILSEKFKELGLN